MENIEYLQNLADSVEQELKETDMTYRRQDKEKAVVFHLMLPDSVISAIALAVIISHDGDVKFFSRLLSAHNDVDRSTILETMNRLNDQYRFIKLVLDEDDDIMCLHDIVLKGSEENSSQMIMETVSLMIRIIDNCMQPLLESIYGPGGKNGQDRLLA